MTERGHRWAWADVDVAAVEHNVGVVRELVAPSEVWAVVKANGYGHGAVAVACAAQRAGATGVCVALTQEGVELRRAGVQGPILLLSEQPGADAPLIVDHRLTPTVYTLGAIDALAAARPVDLGVHLKVDTGMRRVGAAPIDAAVLAERIVAAPGLRLEGVWTHLAIADEPGDAYTSEQLDRFDTVLAALPDVAYVHAANSAGAIAHPRARRSLVRLGIAMYGIAPGPALATRCAALRPAMQLRARVSFVKRCQAGMRISYGLRHRFSRDTTVATVPIGYADGVPRRLFASGGEVLIGGRRRPIVGVVTMDQLMVACDDDPVAVGDEVVLIGEQGGERILADEWAERLDTIAYEIVCGISARIPRHVFGAPS